MWDPANFDSFGSSEAITLRSDGNVIAVWAEMHVEKMG